MVQMMEQLGTYFPHTASPGALWAWRPPSPLPRFEECKDQLPSPIYAAEPLWLEVYWKAWELAFHNFHEPAPGSGFVSQFIDAAFNPNIFLWDTCFMTMFCRYAQPLVPAIASLDNFYVKQHQDGEICREMTRQSGIDYPAWVNTEGKPLFSRWGWGNVRERKEARAVLYKGRDVPQPPPKLTLDGLNHPILAWAELESFRVTGDLTRLARVWEPLVRYYAALRLYLRQGNGLYMTDWASMDNSARNQYLSAGGTGIDISAEMVLFARNLAEIAAALGKQDEVARCSGEADELAALINAHMWDPERQFYFDLTLEGQRCPVKTIAAYWTLLARVALPHQVEALVAELTNPLTFKRLHWAPSLAADEPAYDPSGGYWNGAVWPPTTTMVIRGLEQCGYADLALEIALNHLRVVAEVFRKTGTLWENYAADAEEPGNRVVKDFVGWSGIGPIMYLLEYAIGLKPDAEHNALRWRLDTAQATGCRRFRFNGHVVDLVAEPGSSPETGMGILAHSSGSFRLLVSMHGVEQTFNVLAGKNTFAMAG